ncbi:MAG TPA: VOC family protein [Jiangellaceae bacterium]|nr:VOC family protein [Jiangellaceae bacterium]
MVTQIDHVVWAAPDLDGLVIDAERRTGARPVPGGRHEGRGTRNYVLGLGPQCYLELIGPDPDQPEPSRPRPFAVDSLDRPTLVGWAVRSDSMQDILRTSRAAGYDPGEAEPMSRRQPDGQVLEWLLTPPEGGYDGTVPFVIDWLGSPHPATDLPAVGLRSLTLRHPDVEGVAAALDALELTDRDVVALERGTSAEMEAVLDTPRGPVGIP